MSVVLRCGAFGDRRSTWMRAIICYHRHFCTGNARFAELAQAYEPKVIERVPPKDEFFKPPLIADKEKFNIILPPPNVTGTLHLGHALTAAIQDVLIKWNRMKGAETSWIPGLDHAGIATQVIVEKKLWSEKRKTRREIGRDEFVQEVWRWKEEKSDAIGKQLKRLGVSLDWEKEAFTMDERQSRAVIEAFVRLHESGLVYEADRLVNWSCDLQSAISDIEVDHLEISGPTNVTVPGYKKPVRFGTLTSFAYRLKDSDEEIVVATTRPETILGDVAVAVHPEDPRYSSFIGRHVVHPFSKASIPVVADTFVDRDFGTGAVKITPAHDHNDFAVAKAQGLPIVQVIDENGRVCFAGDFDGLPRFEARDAVINGLNAAGLFRGVQDHAMKVPICSRSKDVVELLLKPQWFVDCKEMAAQCLDAVRIGDLVIEPEQFERVWFEWLENIRDWCISRQLWWGHRIPIYNCTNGTDTCKVVASNASEAKDKAHEILKSDRIEVTQVDDVLDTWFSSALLPFSASGWPDKDISSNYPLSLMETGNDILFFWVARMVMLGTKLTGQLPFNKVLLHGIICDSSGRKMSKSLGNVVAPEDVIEGKTLKDLECQTRGAVTSGLLSEEECKKAVVGQRKMFPDGIPECGVDALRFTLLSHNIKGHTINFEVQECRTNRMFGNKVWQATKFTVKWCEEIAKVGDGGGGETSGFDWVFDPMDRWILSRVACMVEQVDAGIRDHDFHLATAALKNFLYYELCDVYLEYTKKGFRNPSSVEAARNCWVLSKCLDVGFRCLGPFMPHLSQHLHSFLTHPIVRTGGSRYFPEPFDRYTDELVESNVEQMLECVKSIRRLMKLFGVSAKLQPKVHLISSTEKPLEDFLDTIQCLTNCRVSFAQEADGDFFVSDTLTKALSVRLFVPEEAKRALEVDAEKSVKKRERLLKDVEKLQKVMSSDRYANVTEEIHGNNLKKMETLKEKIGRIDYIRSFVK